MNTKALRQKILDLAIHGKLVPQDPNDEPASVLLERIKAEKERLIKEGKIKRSKQSKTACDKLHYAIPDSWTMAEMSDLFLLNPKSEINDEIEAGFIPMACVEDGFSGNHSFETRKWKDIKKGYCHFQNGDIGVAKISPCFENMKSCILNSLPNGVGTGTTELVILRSLGVYAPFYLYLFKSSWYISQGTKYFKGVVGQQRVNKAIFTELEVPLPSVAEQKKIVAEIKRWFALIDIIEQDKSNLQETIKQAKYRILDLAIHGKLVPQDPTDEPACELLKRINPNAEITCDNPHYRNLPKGWAICSLEQVANILDNLRKPINSNERNARINNKHESELFPYYGATGQVGFIDDYLIDGSYLLLGEDGAPFLDKNATKAYSIEGKCWVNNHAHILKPLCNFNYLMYYLNQVDYKDYVNGSTRLKLTQSDMRSIKILLPPMAEQERISTKVKELFYLLDNISYFL